MPLYGKEHVERYLATDGEEGHEWQGTQTLLLTTTGRKSGIPRTTPLIYSRHGGKVMVIASDGGADEPPDWYRNIENDPNVDVQIKGDRFRARARDATPDEKAEMWEVMTREWPAYDEYQKRTDREIPVVVLDPVE